jgi:hypothetical protein
MQRIFTRRPFKRQARFARALTALRAHSACSAGTAQPTLLARTFALRLCGPSKHVRARTLLHRSHRAHRLPLPPRCAAPARRSAAFARVADEAPTTTTTALPAAPRARTDCSCDFTLRCLTFDMSGDRRHAKHAVGRPLDGGVSQHGGAHRCFSRTEEPQPTDESLDRTSSQAQSQQPYTEDQQR